MNSKLLIPRLTRMAFLSSLLATVSSHASPLIIGGNEVPKNHIHATTTVALEMDITVQTPMGPREVTGICTGSLLTREIIVTAAHCVSDEYGKALASDKVRVIFDVNAKQGQKRKSIALLPHPGYRGVFSKGTDHNDIALVKFPSGLPVGYRLATLLPAKLALKPGMVTTLIGYGVNYQHPVFGGDGAGVLRHVSVKVHNPLHGKTEVVLDQTQGRGACHGDSGGPAVVQLNGRTYLWGVTNRGYPDTAPDDCAHYSVYTKINSHSSFVNRGITQLRRVR